MNVIIFLVVLSILVLIHEAGHYFSARAFGIKAKEFGYGFPPRLLGYVKHNGRWKRVKRGDKEDYKNTIWSINWLPLGGFVRIKGEQLDGENDPDSFHMHPVWQRVIVIAAGVTMNWILAICLFTIVFSVGANAVLEDLPASARISDRAVRITHVMADSPAGKTGILINDAILKIAGKAPQNYEEARSLIAAQADHEFEILVQRGTEEKTYKLTPVYIKEVDRMGIGVGLADVGYVSFAPLEAVRVSVMATYGYTKAILFTFGEMFADLLRLQPIKQEVSGPVGIAILTGQIAQQGFIPLLQFAAILSINLAVLNFLPIPALDGGRVLFLVIEKIRRRPMGRRLEAAIHNVAFLILVSLILLVTVRDIGKYSGVILSGFKGLFGG